MQCNYYPELTSAHSQYRDSVQNQTHDLFTHGLHRYLRSAGQHTNHFGNKPYCQEVIGERSDDDSICADWHLKDLCAVIEKIFKLICHRIRWENYWQKHYDRDQNIHGKKK